VSDRAFPFFSQDQADRLRALAQATVAEHGEQTTIQSDHLRGASGGLYLLHTLAALCHQAEGGEAAWPGIVTDYVRSMLAVATLPDPARADLPPDLPATIHLQLLAPKNAPRIANDRTVRDLAPGLVEVLVLDQPDHVETFGDHRVDPFGAEALREAGLANLRAVPIDVYEPITGARGAKLHLIGGVSFFVASKALVLPDLLRATVGDDSAPHGVLLCAPHRHMLAFHVLRDTSAFDAAWTLMEFGDKQYAEAPGQISPAVYWWRDGMFRNVAEIVHQDDEVVAKVDQQFIERVLLPG